MQVKYDSKKDILIIDFANKLEQLEAKQKESTDGFAFISGSKGKTRAIIIYPASKRLPKDFMDKIEKID